MYSCIDLLANLIGKIMGSKNLCGYYWHAIPGGPKLISHVQYVGNQSVSYIAFRRYCDRKIVCISIYMKLVIMCAIRIPNGKYLDQITREFDVSTETHCSVICFLQMCIAQVLTIIM